MAPADLVTVGLITGAHGLKGEVKLKSFTANPGDIARYGPLQSKVGQRFVITKLRLQKNEFIAAIADVMDRNQAEALRNTELFVARSALPAPEPDQVYAHDLIGLKVVSETGEELGHLEAMPNYGAGDLLEVRPPGGKTTLLFPYAKVYVVSEDLERGLITIRLPEGYLDDAKQEIEQ